MQWASASSEKQSLAEAVRETAESVRQSLGDATLDLAVVFASPHYQTDYSSLFNELTAVLRPGTLVGCSAGGVIGGGNEIEQRPGFSLTVASLPAVSVKALHLHQGMLPDADAQPDDWRRLVGFQAEEKPHFVVLADPFSFDPSALVAGLDYAFPDAQKVGGLASSAQQPGANALWLNETVYDSGTVVIGLAGALAVDTVVAQGCRPIGEVMHVTQSERNVIVQINGQPALDTMMKTLSGLTEADKRLAQHALFVGVASNELQETLEPGDFLIRNIMGIDPQHKAIVVGEVMRNGRRIQFHLRDAASAASDLSGLLQRHLNHPGSGHPKGALLFSCLGRGEHLFGRPNHDTQLFESALGPIPLGGFFCSGEIGPVGGTTHLHGFTSSFAIFREP